MIGGLLKTTSLAAIAAVTVAITGAMPASAADLGGNCCADLEERIAELEATTVRKGNRKMSVTLSGFVGHHVMWWDDGNQSDVYFGDGGNYGSRFRFVGNAKISPTLTAGFLYEFGIANNAINSMNQTNGGDDLPLPSASGSAAPFLRDTTVWLQHSQLGKVKIGHGSTATDNLILIDLGGMPGAASSDVALYNGGFQGATSAGYVVASGNVWNSVIRGHDTFDTTRRNHILYETPALAGFTVQAAVAEDNFWDVALRYAGEHHGVRIAFGIGYQEDTEFNLAAGAFVCTNLCDTKSAELKGSISALHVATGLFVTAAAGQRELSGTLNNPVDDATFWYIAGGIRKNFFGFGDTVLYGEYYTAENFYAQARAVNATPANFTALGDDESDMWGIGVNQYIDAAAVDMFLAYKQFSTGGTINGLSIEDFQTVIGGMRVNF